MLQTISNASVWWDSLKPQYQKSTSFIVYGELDPDTLSAYDINRIYARIVPYFTCPQYMGLLGFELVSDDGIYAKYENKAGYEGTFYGRMAVGKRLVYFNREYVAHRDGGYCFVSVREDGDTRTVYNGAVSNAQELELILKLVM